MHIHAFEVHIMHHNAVALKWGTHVLACTQMYVSCFEMQRTGIWVHFLSFYQLTAEFVECEFESRQSVRKGEVQSIECNTWEMHLIINGCKCNWMQNVSRMHPNAVMTHACKGRNSHTAITMQKNVIANECSLFSHAIKMSANASKWRHSKMRLHATHNVMQTIYNWL